MNEVLLIASGPIASVMTFLIMWGATRSKVQDLERRSENGDNEVTELKKDLTATREEFSEKINSLKDEYVSYRHHEASMQLVKENYRDLKASVDKVLVILSERS